MKKEEYTQFKHIVHANIVKICLFAYAAKGTKEEAEQLAVDAIVFGCRKFRGLANKERVLNVILAYVGDGADEPDASEVDYESVFLRAMDAAQQDLRRRKKNKSVLAAVISVGLCAAILIALLLSLYTPDVQGLVVMKNTAVITGDLGNAELLNYHNMTDTLKELGKHPKTEVYNREIDRTAAVITAPDGNVYAAYYDFSPEDTFPLLFFRATKNGWEQVGSGRGSGASEAMYMGISPYYTSEIKMVCDKENNIYLFVICEKNITIYRYLKKNGVFEKLPTEIPFVEPSSTQTVTPYYDGAYGESGAIYLGCNQTGYADFIRYDIASDEYVYMIEEIYLKSGAATFEFAVKDDRIYLLLNDQTNYDFCILSEGQKKLPKMHRIYTGKPSLTDGHFQDSKGFLFDKNGTLHLLMERDEFIPENGYLPITTGVHYIIEENGEYVKATLPQLYFTDMPDYTALHGEMFLGNDGELYYIEIYDKFRNFFTVGRISTNDPAAAVLVDAFETTENIYNSMICAKGNDIVFYSEYDTITYCYFHLIDKAEE